MIKKIQEILQRKKREKVRKEYLELIEKHPDDTRSRLKLGDLYAKGGSKLEAVEQYMASAEIFSRAGFHLKSIALFKQVLKLEPNSVPALRKAAKISFQYGLHADAMPYYEKLAGILRNDKKNDALLNVYDEISSLSIRETKRKIQILEAIFPGVGASFTDPYDRLVSIGKEMSREGTGKVDSGTLAQWITGYYPEGIEGHELLVGIIADTGDQEALSESLDRLEALCKKKGKLEEKSELLKKYHQAVEWMAGQDTIRDKPKATIPKSSDQVKVKMEANVYDLLKKKAKEGLDEEQNMTGEGAPPGAGKSALDRLEFKDLFENFKESIQGQVAEDDSETHYNLGVAYLEMELYEDAVEEFRLASQNPALQNDAFFMMGNCSRQLERMDEALVWYEKALSTAGLELQQACAIRYELALTLQAADRKEDALGMFQEIQKIDSNYRDIEAIIKELL